METNEVQLYLIILVRFTFSSNVVIFLYLKVVRLTAFRAAGP